MISLDDEAGAAVRWWLSLGPITTDAGRTLPGDRAALARLRRCSSVMEAAVEPATARLFKMLELDRTKDEHLARAAALAAILAHVRKDGSGKLAHAIGVPSRGEASDALLKPFRFRTLMAARTPDEVLTGFRRVVAILDRSANVRDLSRVVLGWTDDNLDAADRIRTRFAFDYHGAGDYAPHETSAPTVATAEKA